MLSARVPVNPDFLFQSPATGTTTAAATASPFYNLQTFPGCYQPSAFPPITPAYLHSIWPQGWQSPARTIAHFQHHQMQYQQQQQQHQHPKHHLPPDLQPYVQLTGATWMADTAASLIGTTDSQLRSVGHHQQHQLQQQQQQQQQQQHQPSLKATASVQTTLTGPLRPDPDTAAATRSAAALSSSGPYMQSFTQRTSSPRTFATSATLGTSHSSGAAVAAVQHASPILRSHEVQKISRSDYVPLTVADVAEHVPLASRVQGIAGSDCVRPSPGATEHVPVASSRVHEEQRIIKPECIGAPGPEHVVALASGGGHELLRFPKPECVEQQHTPLALQTHEMQRRMAADGGGGGGGAAAEVKVEHDSLVSPVHETQKPASRPPGCVAASEAVELAAASQVREMQRTPAAAAAAAAAQATPSTLDSVKRAECDSSVPSPPKTTTSQVSMLGGPAMTMHRDAAAAAAVAAASHASAAVGIVENAHIQAQHVQVTPTAPAIAAKHAAARSYRLAGLEELTEDLLEYPPAPAVITSTEAPSASVEPAAATVRQEPEAEETSERRETRKPPSSPKRRGHGHSDSSRSPSRTPVVAEAKPEPKKRRKNTEVAMLLNDLTEVAWSHLARKSTKKIIAPTQTRYLFCVASLEHVILLDDEGILWKVCTSEANEEEEDKECSSSESEDSEKPQKKPSHQQRKTTKSEASAAVKSVTFSRASETAPKAGPSGRRRGRPPKAPGTAEPKSKARKKKTTKKSSSSSSCNSDSEPEEKKKSVKKTLPAPKDRPMSAAEKIELALGMARKKRPKKRSPETDDDDDDEGSSAASSSSSSSSSTPPARRTWSGASQRKTGSTPGSRGVSKKKVGRTGRTSRAAGRAAPRKRTAKAAATAGRRRRKKKNRSSSSSESGK
ncbi:unnamed protein product [Gongylonema pulchrum]|uniref:Uncharacterized protein n=1 Tax=Gongylonema pulchrum TaxID=637853 RepID=A0A3P6NTD3_9BILA|nr:unnamed protein product [Gongylonema pulchrum]